MRHHEVHPSKIPEDTARNAANLYRELTRRQRLPQYLGGARVLRSLDDCRIGEAGHQDDRNLRPNGTDLPSEFRTSETRHAFVGDHRVEPFRIGEKRGERRGAGAEADRCVAQLAQCLGGKPEKRGFVGSARATRKAGGLIP